MSNMFMCSAAFNQNIDSWQTGNATDFDGMFYNTNEFN